jgi:hypothetical protein
MFFNPEKIVWISNGVWKLDCWTLRHYSTIWEPNKSGFKMITITY